MVQRSYQDDQYDSWLDWFNRKLLTRGDGLWLADGVDIIPLDALVNLQERIGKEIGITGDKAKLLELLKIKTSLNNELVIAGDWCSVDGVNIHITSALAPSELSDSLALKLSKEGPFQAWLPMRQCYENSEEYSHSEKSHFIPWIVWPDVDVKLDEYDPVGVNTAARRLRLIENINQVSSLNPLDSFKRNWATPGGKIKVRSEAWSESKDVDESFGARRLVCSSNFLKSTLINQQTDLVIYIKLSLYEKSYGSKPSQYWHSTAVVRITGSLTVKYYSGVVNELHKSNF